jgi:hypothetical protein
MMGYKTPNIDPSAAEKGERRQDKTALASIPTAWVEHDGHVGQVLAKLK